jgi:hypothetical protein
MASIKKMREKKNSAKVWRRIIKNLVKIFLLFSGCPPVLSSLIHN